MKRIIAFAAGAALIACMTMGAPNLKAASRVRICHVEGQQSGRENTFWPHHRNSVSPVCAGRLPEIGWELGNQNS